METRDRLIDKVAKLLRQAESVDGTPEADMFRSRAFELIAKYGIDEALVLEKQTRAELPPEAIEWTVRVQGSWQHAQMLLLFSLGHSLHCEVAYKSGTPLVVKVYGMPNHIDRVRILWELLQPEMLRQVQVVRPEDDGRGAHGGRVRRYRRAWIAGFAAGIGERLREQEQRAVQAAGSAAVALYKSDADRAEEKMQAMNPRIKVTTAASFDGAGYRQGRVDSRNALLNRPVSV